MPERPSAAQRGYNNRWNRLRKLFLMQHPLCERCLQIGRTTAAVIVHHTVPHKGDNVLFWDQSLWQALCKHHHDSEAQSAERGGAPVVQVDRDGWPIEERR